jgi:hypothetical protein
MNNLYAQLFVYDDSVCECTESLEYSVQCTESQQRDGFLRSVIGCVDLTPKAKRLLSSCGVYANEIAAGGST